MTEPPNTHRVIVEFNDYGVYAKRLIHPTGGCAPATQCAMCGRDANDPESGDGCYDCKNGFGVECWVQGWFDNEGIDTLRGEIEVVVDPEYDRDRCVLHIAGSRGGR
jgi:hypothetical protein